MKHLLTKYLSILTFLFVCIGNAYDADYFPENMFSNSVVSWYSKHLIALREPSLYKKNKIQAYRFTWLRTFDNPIAVRVEVYDDGSGKLLLKRTDGKGGYEPGKLVLDQSVVLSKNEALELLRRVDDCKFWKLPIREDKFGKDGAQWIIEGIKNQKYHIVDRWSPRSGCIKELGLYFIKLSGMEVNEVY